jgi:hypothetical protein
MRPGAAICIRARVSWQPHPTRRSFLLAPAILTSLRDAAFALSLAAPLLGAGGCIVHVYQPLSGLHRPVVVDPQVANFQDVRLTVHCVPGGLVTQYEASSLCQKVGTLFGNQGAQVTTTVGGPREEAVVEEGAPAVERTDLTLELRARKVHASSHPLSWVAMIASFTLVPGVTESTFAQDVVIRDGDGFLLATDTLQGRLVHYFGFGMWAGNKLLDVTMREEEDEIIGPVANEDLSSDLYRQLSQSMFNAKMQRRVLREADPSDAGDPAR